MRECICSKGWVGEAPLCALICTPAYVCVLSRIVTRWVKWLIALILPPASSLSSADDQSMCELVCEYCIGMLALTRSNCLVSKYLRICILDTVITGWIAVSDK